jgi:hypothetical protein
MREGSRSGKPAVASRLTAGMRVDTTGPYQEKITGRMACTGGTERVS